MYYIFLSLFNNFPYKNLFYVISVFSSKSKYLKLIILFMMHLLITYYDLPLFYLYFFTILPLFLSKNSIYPILKKINGGNYFSKKKNFLI